MEKALLDLKQGWIRDYDSYMNPNSTSFAMLDHRALISLAESFYVVHDFLRARTLCELVLAGPDVMHSAAHETLFRIAIAESDWQTAKIHSAHLSQLKQLSLELRLGGCAHPLASAQERLQPELKSVPDPHQVEKLLSLRTRVVFLDALSRELGVQAWTQAAKTCMARADWVVSASPEDDTEHWNDLWSAAALYSRGNDYSAAIDVCRDSFKRLHTEMSAVGFDRKMILEIMRFRRTAVSAFITSEDFESALGETKTALQDLDFLPSGFEDLEVLENRQSMLEHAALVLALLGDSSQLKDAFATADLVANSSTATLGKEAATDFVVYRTDLRFDLLLLLQTHQSDRSKRASYVLPVQATSRKLLASSATPVTLRHKLLEQLALCAALVRDITEYVSTSSVLLESQMNAASEGTESEVREYKDLASSALRSISMLIVYQQFDSAREHEAKILKAVEEVASRGDAHNRISLRAALEKYLDLILEMRSDLSDQSSSAIDQFEYCVLTAIELLREREK